MEGSYPSAEKQSVYFTAPADWAKLVLCIIKYHIILIDLFCFQPNFLLGYSLWDNLMLYWNQGVIYEITPR